MLAMTAIVIARSPSHYCHCEERQRRGNLDAWANVRRGAKGEKPLVAFDEVAALRSQ